ncbi:DUF1015 family protein [Nocardiopsis alba]|uniref:DUF1015 family protein n=1 Tax=Nocardiopsis alba TaxID=53437 RepID=A0A7K2IME1_9ACTN|nr:DUF1015 domain-containing protein [Nocardiopsis alba]MYR31148.1 DUF1015 family protein [Nocardiopsis alba]
MPRRPLDLAPFRGLRYAAPDVDRFIDGDFDLSRLLAPPYDIPDAREARELQRSDPYNAARVTLPYALSRHTAGEDTTAHRYRGAAERLHGWISDGRLVRDPEPALYVYEQVTPNGETQRGLIGALRLPDDDTDPSPVRPHENVAEPPVRDRFLLMDETRTNLEPIFLIYRGGGGAATTITETIPPRERPLISTRTADGAHHRLWAITDPELHRRVSDDLAARSALIADGHHRYAAYRRLRSAHEEADWGYGLALLVDSDTHPPRLGSIHRVLPGLDTERALAAARTVALVEPVPAPDPAIPNRTKAPALLLASPEGETHMVHGFDETTLEQASPGHSTAWRHLATAALHEVLLPLWRYPERRVRMVHDDPHEAVELTRATRGTAVIVPPMRIDQIYALTDQGELTPRKSTSFGPKPRTGLVMRTLD